MEEFFTVAVSLGLVILLILATYYGARWLNKRTTVTSSQNMRVVERINMGPDKMLLLVNVCGKYMLVGVTSQRIEKLCDLGEEESALLDARLAARPGTPGGFSAQLAAVIAARFRGGRDTPPETRDSFRDESEDRHE